MLFAQLRRGVGGKGVMLHGKMSWFFVTLLRLTLFPSSNNFPYNQVHDIRYRTWVHLDVVMDDDQLCKVWYRGTPITSNICEGAHKAQNCPFMGKCM